jgi:transcriptional repressor NrdR
MFCPFCGDSSTRVIDSRLAGASVRRRRSCPACERRFTTYERYDEGPLYLRKRDGGREPFDRDKLLAGLERAAIKRPIEREQLEAIVDRTVAELRARGGTPEASDVGELALRGLRELDPVAYVRFASVYKKFADVAEFEAELERLEHAPPLQTTALFDAGKKGGARSSSIRTESQATELPPKTADGAKNGRGRGASEGLLERNDERQEE